MIQKPEDTHSNSIIGVRFPKDVVSAIKQEAARRNIRINQLMLELWENYQREKEGN